MIVSHPSGHFQCTDCNSVLESQDQRHACYKWPNGPSALSQWERDLGLTAASGQEWYKGSGGLEACEVVEQFALPYHLGEVVCHILRAGRKPGVPRRADLRNALWHLQRELSRSG